MLISCRAADRIAFYLFLASFGPNQIAEFGQQVVCALPMAWLVVAWVEQPHGTPRRATPAALAQPGGLDKIIPLFFLFFVCFSAAWPQRLWSDTPLRQVVAPEHYMLVG